MTWSRPKDHRKHSRRSASLCPTLTPLSLPHTHPTVSRNTIRNCLWSAALWFPPPLLAFRPTVQLQGQYTFLGASRWKFNLLSWFLHFFHPADIRFQCRVLYAFLNFVLFPPPYDRRVTSRGRRTSYAGESLNMPWDRADVFIGGENMLQSTHARTHIHLRH